MQALNTAATGMAAQELSVQVISNNIANLQTTGYKKQTAEFQDLIYQHIARVGAQASQQGTILPIGIDIGSVDLAIMGIGAYDPSVGYLEVTHFYPEFVHDGWWQAALTVPRQREARLRRA